jgi:serine/threonine-protein kinase
VVTFFWIVKEGDLVADRYRLLRRIGAGAMGTVWAARHEVLGREVALKICDEAGRGEGRPAAGCRDKRDLFLREVRTVSRLRHPNVVDIADAGDAGPQGLYLAMELLEGEPLAQRIARSPLPPAEALAIAAELCRGLAAAHAAGVVHRDLKPENVFLGRGPGGGVTPKLLDFGVSSARGAAESTTLGTPAYMSPEQALGEQDVDHRTDVWAMGVVLYEMITAQLPFQADSYPALLPLIIEAPTPPLPESVSAEVRTVIAGCLAKDRDDRYPSADALRAAIERALLALPDPTVNRSNFVVETSTPGVAGGEAGYPPASGGPPGARPARGLAAAVVAVTLAIGVAALAARTGRGKPHEGSLSGSAASATASALELAAPPTAVDDGGSAVASPPDAQAAGRPQDIDPVGGHPQAPAVAPKPSTGAPASRGGSRSAPVRLRKVTNVNNAGF